MAITEITRRNLFDALGESKINLYGRLDEIGFLSRIYDLKSIPGNGDDNVYDEMVRIESETQRHVANMDYELLEFIDHIDVIADSRFGLQDDDATLLRFLCETVHPLVRPDAEEVKRLLQIYNMHLKHDGFQIVESARISGKPIYTARNVGVLGIPNLPVAKQALDLGSYISTQITRMDAAVSDDPELAIGTAKELVETCCRTILEARNEGAPKPPNINALVKATCSALALTPDDVPSEAKAAGTIKRLLSNLATVAQGVAELRNSYGTGHGKPAGTKGLQSRHAKLAVGAATTLAVFLVETHQVRGDQKNREK